MIRKFLSLAWLAILCCANAQDTNTPDRKFTRTEDVIYGRAYGTALTLDIFRPENANGLGVVYVMSGGWYSSHDGISARIFQPILNHGYTVFAVVHGSNPRFHIQEICGQMERSVRFIRHHAKEYGIDPDHIGVSGGSAGGHLSLMLATCGGPGQPDAKDLVDKESSAVQAVGCFFPPTDFLNYGTVGESAVGEGVLKDFRSAFGDVPSEPAAKKQFAESISPIYHVKAGVPPIFIIHGDADKLVPIQQAQIFLNKVKDVGGKGQLDSRAGMQHGWKNWEADSELFAQWFDQNLKPKNKP
jgi:acetyl esterase/lipase